MLTRGQERTFLAILAVLVGVEICLIQKHFVLEANAGSFMLMTQHRCGDAMLLAVSWALVEIGLLSFAGWRGSRRLS